MTDDSVTEGGAVYLHVTIQLVRGKHHVFAAAMAEMAPVLESQGWRLIGAFHLAISPVPGIEDRVELGVPLRHKVHSATAEHAKVVS